MIVASLLIPADPHSGAGAGAALEPSCGADLPCAARGRPPRTTCGSVSATSRAPSSSRWLTSGPKTPDLLPYRHALVAPIETRTHYQWVIGVAGYAERTRIDRSANELPVADAAAVGLVVAPWFRVIPRSALIVPAGGAWLADARDAERRGGRALTIAAAGVDRDAEAAAVALAGRAADAPPALRAAGQPLRAVGVSATLPSR